MEPEQAEVVYQKWRAGKSYGELADEYGASYRAVRALCRRRRERDAIRSVRRERRKVDPVWRDRSGTERDPGTPVPDGPRCAVAGCRNSHQPGKAFCAEHNPVRASTTVDRVCAELVIG